MLQMGPVASWADESSGGSHALSLGCRRDGGVCWWQSSILPRCQHHGRDGRRALGPTRLPGSHLPGAGSGIDAQWRYVHLPEPGGHNARCRVGAAGGGSGRPAVQQPQPRRRSPQRRPVAVAHHQGDLSKPKRSSGGSVVISVAPWGAHPPSEDVVVAACGDRLASETLVVALGPPAAIEGTGPHCLACITRFFFISRGGTPLAYLVYP